MTSPERFESPRSIVTPERRDGERGGVGERHGKDRRSEEDAKTGLRREGCGREEEVKRGTGRELG